MGVTVEFKMIRLEFAIDVYIIHCISAKQCRIRKLNLSLQQQKPRID